MKLTDIDGDTYVSDLSTESREFFTWWATASTKDKKEVIEIVKQSEPGAKSTIKIIRALDEFCEKNK